MKLVHGTRKKHEHEWPLSFNYQTVISRLPLANFDPTSVQKRYYIYVIKSVSWSLPAQSACYTPSHRLKTAVRNFTHIAVAPFTPCINIIQLCRGPMLMHGANAPTTHRDWNAFRSA